MLLKIILSALLYNLAFFYTDPLGFLVLIYWIPLIYIDNKNFTAGFVLGLLTFAPHCIWLLVLLLTKSNATVALSITLYLIIVLYYSVLSGLLFKISQALKLNRAGFTALFALYHYLLSKYSLWFVSFENLLEGAGGYPFFSPLIPLASCKWFIALISLFSNTTSTNLHNYKIIHLKPDMDYRQSAEVAGQRIFHQLLQLELNENHPTLIVAPESTFPFDIEKYPHIVNLWSYAMPKKTHLLIGLTHSKIINNVSSKFQSIAHINTGRIMQAYEKQNLVPFVEKLYKPWDMFEWGRGLFLSDNPNNEFFKGTNCVSFAIEKDFVVTPCMCSELFFSSSSRGNMIFFFVNDSWFIDSFKCWMKNYVRLWAALSGCPVLYIGFDDLILM